MTNSATTRYALGRVLYRALLFGSPRDFRHRYGALMEAAFIEERARTRGQRRSRLGFWVFILCDTARTAVGERLAGWRSQRLPHRPDLSELPTKSPVEMLQDLLRDARYSARVLVKSPVFTVVALTILALGIGANTVVFTIIDSLFYTPPPGVGEPGDLVRLTRTHDESISGSLSYPAFEVLRDRNRTFDGIAAYDADGAAVTVSRAGSAERSPAHAAYVSGNFFSVLRVDMYDGRAFSQEENRVPREGAVTVLGYAFWQRAFGSDPSVVGEDLTLNGHPFTVVGIAARGFTGASPVDPVADLWVTTMMQPVLAGREDNAFLERVEDQRIHWLAAVGRLATGTTIEQATADLDGVSAYLEENFGEWNQGRGTAVSRDFMYLPSTRERLMGFTWLLGSVVALVLLIVCANIAILQLARASWRQREVGIRAALGAGRGAIVRQMLIESLLLAGAGALGGYVAAIWLSRMAASLLPMSFTVDFRPDGGVLLFTMIVASFAALLFGMIPAMTAARTDVVRAIQSRGIASGRSGVRNALVVLQVAISLVLVTGAALFVRSLVIAENIDPGFATEGRVLVRVNLQNHGYGLEERQQLVADVMARLGALPQVDGVTLAIMSPFRGAWSSGFNPDGDASEGAEEVDSYMNGVGPNYFRTMEIDLLAGREFTLADGYGADPVLIVNQAAADRFWPGDNPMGKMVALMSDEPVDRVIGVVANTNYRALGEEPEPIIYAPALQVGFPALSFVVSSRGDSAQIAAAVQREILAVDPTLAFSRVRTIEEALESQIGTYRLGARAVGLFGLLAALLAAVGLYGVLSYLVAAETREIGIRMALGATAGGVTGGIVSRGLKLALGGVVLGLVLALALSRTIASMLYEVSPYDPVSFVAVPLLLVGVASLASLLPARRAARVDPIEALRAD